MWGKVRDGRCADGETHEKYGGVSPNKKYGELNLHNPNRLHRTWGKKYGEIHREQCPFVYIFHCRVMSYTVGALPDGENGAIYYFVFMSSPSPFKSLEESSGLNSVELTSISPSFMPSSDLRAK